MPPVCTDDFTKAADRVCNVPDCGKPFHIALEGDYGVKWYKDKGMFLPRRCDVCIKSGKTKSQFNGQRTFGNGTQSNLCDMHDPEAVDTHCMPHLSGQSQIKSEVAISIGDQAALRQAWAISHGLF